MPPYEPMSSTCPRCGHDLAPVLLQEPSPPSGPLSAEVPVVMRCLECAERAEGRVDRADDDGSGVATGAPPTR
jgi:hypothetical protein